MKKELTNTEAVFAAEELETLCASVHPAVGRTRDQMEKRYYERLAEEALGPKWQDGAPREEVRPMLEAVQGELDRLHHADRKSVV